MGNKSPKKEIIRNNFKDKVKLSLAWGAVEFGLLEIKGEIILGRKSTTNHRHGIKK